MRKMREKGGGEKERERDREREREIVSMLYGMHVHGAMCVMCSVRGVGILCCLKGA